MRIFQRVCALVVAIILLTSVAFAAQKRQYVDATSLTIINKAQNDGLPLNRIDVEQFDIPKIAKVGLRHSTGLPDRLSAHNARHTPEGRGRARDL